MIGISIFQLIIKLFPLYFSYFPFPIFPSSLILYSTGTIK